MEQKKTIDYWKSQLDELWLSNMTYIHKGKDINQAILESFGELIADESRLNNSDASDFKRLINRWLSNKRPSYGTNGTQRKLQDLTGI